MSMRARPHLHYAPVPNGVYLSGPRTQFVFGGPPKLYGVFDVCVPLLEDGATEDELVAALGSERARPVVRRITAELARRDLLLDPGAFTEPEPSAELRARHPEALAHIEAVAADPYAVFARLRAARVLLYGPAEVTLPAARGLHRAGVTRIVLAAADREAVAATAERLGATVADRPEDLPARIDAVLYHPPAGTDPDELPDGIASRVVPDAPVVRVSVGERVVIVGPPHRGTAPHPLPRELARRADEWAGDEEPLPHPAADALSGAIAGQTLFEALTTGDTGEAHVLHGSAMAADPVAVATVTDPGSTAPRTLHTIGTDPVPDPDAAVEAVTALTSRWTGLFAPTPGAELPQLPLALRESGDRPGGPGTVVAWARDQRTATVAVTLAALRARCGGKGVAAAGLTEEHWLLDGVLRLLAEEAVPLSTRRWNPGDPAPRELLPLLRALEEEEGATPLTVTLLHHPALDWRLARVEVDGDPSAGGGPSWGRNDTEALGGALAALLARLRADAVPGGGRVPDGAHTDALLFADGAVLTELRKRLTEHAAVTGVEYRGVPRPGDPVLGEPPLWWGGVEVHTVAGAGS
ncbi:hypothetical protein [Streptomyces sp. ST2-7A]|uniref:hypothetical protein n=1 Tax=Streptomyces sp. ST2-7A TaxID=2907214 RepID=UPI001F29D3D4|nr:hypothetical protein [Streptomyces sp. ST2-7A]MCE7080562.1 hypothetical protein [Streptomyces sp. ST2-7A]